jgi:hypothetical protein
VKKQQIEHLLRIALAGFVLVGGAGLVSACTDNGPFEEAGEEIDQSIDNIEDRL